MLNVVLLNVIMLSVVMLNVVAPFSSRWPQNLEYRAWFREHPSLFVLGLSDK
jgi:hypothetical protein